MTLIEHVKQNMKLLNASYNEDSLGEKYQYYIETVCKFNSEKDRIEFNRGKHSIADIMKYSKAANNTNETLVDWTQVKPGYILVVKDKEILEQDVLSRAEQLAQQNNLPLVVYDSYAIKQNTSGTGNYMNTNQDTNTK